MYFYFQQNESIFFVETNEEMFDLRPRSLCSLESAAKNNPNRDVYFLMSSKALFTKFPQYMNKYTNVKFRFLNIDKFTKVGNIT